MTDFPCAECGHSNDTHGEWGCEATWDGAYGAVQCDCEIFED